MISLGIKFLWRWREYMSKKLTYEELKMQENSLLEWHGINSTELCFEKSSFSFKRNHINYNVDILVVGNEKIIKVQADIPVPFEILYLYLCDVRRFEYLLDGAFYRMTKCEGDGEDVTDPIALVELGYFTNDKYKHKISLELSDKEYKYYFLKWLKLQSTLGIINQVALFANCINGLTADLRISLLSECFEALGKKFEKAHKIIVLPEEATTRKVSCKKCKREFDVVIKGKKTFMCYMMALIEEYGRVIFATEYRRRKSLLQKIVKTRNKVFHVNEKQKKTLSGAQCGLYAIKLEWMLRYIIWLELGVPKDRLDTAVIIEIQNFEAQFPQLIY